MSSVHMHMKCIHNDKYLKKKKSANWRRSFLKNYSRTAVLALQATWAIVVGQGDGVVNVCSDWLGFSENCVTSPEAER